ncbi:hypothetical protein BDV96DRAFT_604467 [Lophiotrema nucula]|uniref:Uncharacterized protein n=1 Tax=Lophiotrema nucula TaxID=690887 RepID=A0A6A5YTZ9_9PLEO|nr:hypothetical protein BDV96DRAFT_604467 [Lophiotrema nucula]
MAAGMDKGRAAALYLFSASTASAASWAWSTQLQMGALQRSERRLVESPRCYLWCPESGSHRGPHARLVHGPNPKLALRSLRHFLIAGIDEGGTNKKGLSPSIGAVVICDSPKKRPLRASRSLPNALPATKPRIPRALRRTPDLFSKCATSSHQSRASTATTSRATSNDSHLRL